MKEVKTTPAMREAAKEVEAALFLASEIVDRITHEGIHDNPQLIASVMLAIGANFNARSIIADLDDIASAIRESVMH
jgi:hypothetical protein